jgi:hypothetical protein
VWWFKADTDVPVHKVTATQDGDSYQLKFSSTLRCSGIVMLMLNTCRCSSDGGRWWGLCRSSWRWVYSTLTLNVY